MNEYNDPEEQGVSALPARSKDSAIETSTPEPDKAGNGPHTQRHQVRLDPVAIRQCEEVQTRLWLTYNEGRQTKATVFVGATAGCGVSTVAANFAASLAQADGSRVLLIVFDDTRTDSLAIQQDPDFKRLLDENFTAPHSSADLPPNMYLLRSASLGSTVASVLQSQAFDDFLTLARERFDHIVIDAAPLQSHPETLVLCRKADGVVLVVRAGRTRNRAALWARQHIEQARGNLAGVVLNRRRYYIPEWIYRLL